MGFSEDNDLHLTDIYMTKSWRIHVHSPSLSFLFQKFRELGLVSSKRLSGSEISLSDSATVCKSTKLSTTRDTKMKKDTALTLCRA